MGEIRQHKFLLAELLDRLEAVAVRLEGLSPPTAPLPTDPAALEAADRYIKMRTLELQGGGVPDDSE